MVPRANTKHLFVLSLLVTCCSSRDRKEATCGVETAGVEDVRIFLTDLDDGALPGRTVAFDVAWGPLSDFNFLNLVSIQGLIDTTKGYFAPGGISGGENPCEVTEVLRPAATKGRKLLGGGPCFPTFGCGPTGTSGGFGAAEEGDKRVGFTLCIQQCCVSFHVKPGLVLELYRIGQRTCDFFG